MPRWLKVALVVLLAHAVLPGTTAARATGTYEAPVHAGSDVRAFATSQVSDSVTTTTSAVASTHHAPIVSRVDDHPINTFDARPALLDQARARSAPPPVGARALSTTPSAPVVATNTEGDLGFVCHSFAPSTLVVLADGTHKAIADVVVGDRVRATDPATGETVVRTVTRLHRNHDSDLTDITVRDGDGHLSVVHTTQLHRFWNNTRGGWVNAVDLKAGERLHGTDNVELVEVVAVHSSNDLQWMYDLTVDDVHTYYVVTGDNPILVHNCGGTATAEGPSFFRGAKPDEAPSFEPRPNDFKVDPATGTVKPTHGVSVFDNPGSVTSNGFVPHEVDLSSVPPELRIIQRGADPAHFEIMPQMGADLSPEQYKGLICQIVCKP